MFGLFFLSCLGQLDGDPVDQRLTALEAARAADQATIARLEADLAQLQQQVEGVEARVAPSVGSPNRAMDALLGSTGATADCTLQDDDIYTLPASTTQSASELLRQVRVIPHRGADGAPDGYRLSGVRRGSTVERCGLRNGDVIRTVGDMPLTSVEEAMAAWSTHRDSAQLTVSITRRGQEQTLRYRVVDDDGAAVP